MLFILNPTTAEDHCSPICVGFSRVHTLQVGMFLITLPGESQGEWYPVMFQNGGVMEDCRKGMGAQGVGLLQDYLRILEDHTIPLLIYRAVPFYFMDSYL